MGKLNCKDLDSWLLNGCKGLAGSALQDREGPSDEMKSWQLCYYCIMPTQYFLYGNMRLWPKIKNLRCTRANIKSRSVILQGTLVGQLTSEMLKSLITETRLVWTGFKIAVRLKIELEFLLRKTTARLNFKIDLGTLHTYPVNFELFVWFQSQTLLLLTKSQPGVDFINPCMLFAKHLHSAPNFYA